jgi:hypothetical protein
MRPIHVWRSRTPAGVRCAHFSYCNHNIRGSGLTSKNRWRWLNDVLIIHCVACIVAEPIRMQKNTVNVPLRFGFNLTHWLFRVYSCMFCFNPNHTGIFAEFPCPLFNSVCDNCQSKSTTGRFRSYLYVAGFTITVAGNTTVASTYTLF